MSIQNEYVISKPITNNQVDRPVDTKNRRELWRIVALVALSVLLVLFTAQMRSQVLQYSRNIERLRAEESEELALNRQLRLNVETLSAPQTIERRALALGMARPALRDTLIIERLPGLPAPDGVVALAR